MWSSGQSSWLQIQRSRVRFLALPDFLRSSCSATGSTQPCEDKWRAAAVKKTEINGRGNSLRWLRKILYPQNLALHHRQRRSSFGTVRLWTAIHGVCLFYAYTQPRSGSHYCTNRTVIVWIINIVVLVLFCLCCDSVYSCCLCLWSVNC
jgi:hypothetical protein